MIHRNVIVITCDVPGCSTRLDNFGFGDRNARTRARLLGWNLAADGCPDLCPDHAQRKANVLAAAAWRHRQQEPQP